MTIRESAGLLIPALGGRCNYWVSFLSQSHDYRHLVAGFRSGITFASYF